MKREHKIGIAITCTFLCLAGAVIGLKMQEQPAPQPPEKEIAQASETVHPEPESPKRSMLGYTEATGKLPPPETTPSARNGMRPSGDAPPLPEPPVKREREPNAITPPAPDSTGSGTPGLGDDPHLSSPKGSLPQPLIPEPSSPQQGKKDRTNKREAEDHNEKEPPAPTMSFDAKPARAQDNKKSDANQKQNPPSKSVIQRVSGGSPEEVDLSGPDEKGGKDKASDKKADAEPKEKKPLPLPSEGKNSLGGSPDPAMDKMLSTGMPMSPSTPPVSHPGDKNLSGPASPLPSSKSSIAPTPTPSGSPPALVTPPSSSGAVSSAPGPIPLDRNPGGASPSEGIGASRTAPPPLLDMSNSRTSRPAEEKKEDKKVAPLSPTRALPPPSEPTPIPSGSPIPSPSAPPTGLAPSPKPRPASGSLFEEDPHSRATPAGGATPGASSLPGTPTPLPIPEMAKPSSAGAASTAPGRINPTPSASAPTAPEPLERGKPQVIVFNEQDYVCQKDDTFETISKHFFKGSGKYAAALQRHNQNHARASSQMASSGKITLGERIFVPPADILEQRYPDAIEQARSPSGSGAVPASFISPGRAPAPPPPLPEGGADLKAVPPIAPAPTPLPPLSAPPGNFPPPPSR